MKSSRLVTFFILLNSVMYLLLLLSEWLAPGTARVNASIIGMLGAGFCAVFGAKLIRSSPQV